NFEVPVAGALALIHGGYYCYFYKVFHQTPGQVFLKLELRDPVTGNIAIGKIITRWLAMVFLNLFNLVPLFWGSDLLLDRLSRTYIRQLKND
ncbi:MAG: hypothetical protein C5B54_03325, partial [Acidobacteria bacterium]